MRKYLCGVVVFIFLCLTGCAGTGRIMFISTGNPVSDVLVNAMIEEGIAQVGSKFASDLIAEQKPNFLAFLDGGERKCRNPEIDYRSGVRFCGDWD